MTKKTKTSIREATRTEAMQGKAFGKANFPCLHSSTKAKFSQVRIADYLHRGQENALSRRKLEDVLQMDGREIRRQIEIERRQGVPILSDCKRGYFLAESPGEVEACVNSLRRRAQEILVTASAIEGAGGCL